MKQFRLIFSSSLMRMPLQTSPISSCSTQKRLHTGRVQPWRQLQNSLKRSFSGERPGTTRNWLQAEAEWAEEMQEQRLNTYSNQSHIEILRADNQAGSYPR